MKKVMLILVTSILMFTNCEKSTNAPEKQPAPTCSIDISKLQDVTWNPVNTALAKLKFTLGNVYYENTTNVGSWVKIGCDSLHITGTKNFYYRITSVTNDTLVLLNPTFGNLKFFK